VDRPRIAVLLDENTSEDATRYEASKTYFAAVRDAGGLPFGIPYLPEIVAPVLDDFDGLLCVGGRFAYPDAWYLDGMRSPFPESERLGIERALMEGFLSRDKPVLGICAGMQMLACLHGCRLSPDLKATRPGAGEHDKRGHIHAVELASGSMLAGIVGQGTLPVNSRHREEVAAVSSRVVASAHAGDGVVEAVEVPGRRFALGLQWHQEAFAGTDHPGNRIFNAFVGACA